MNSVAAALGFALIRMGCSRSLFAGSPTKAPLVLDRRRIVTGADAGFLESSSPYHGRRSCFRHPEKRSADPPAPGNQ